MFQKQINKILSFLLKKKLNIKLIKLPITDKHVTRIEVKNKEDYNITLVCIEIRYKRKNRQSFSLDKTIKIYNVYCLHHNDMPENIKELLNEELYIPSPLPFFIPSYFQRIAAINAFINLHVIKK